MPTLPKSLERALHAAMLLLAAVFLALHFSHLTADFPNNSPWMDWSKYTDEGWYGDAAIRHYQLGHWFVDGDFNPAAALPVWPFLEALVFHFTGVSLAAVRALTVVVFAGILVASYFLLRRGALADNPDPETWAARSLAAPIAVVLLATSPFCFVFTRLAILEPLLILLTLLALLVASRAQPITGGWKQIARENLGPILTLGLLLPLMVLTKTTALFLFPAVAWLLFATLGYRTRSFLAVAVPAGALGLALWGAYFFVLVRPHFLLDYRYLFSANAYTGITRSNVFQVLHDTVHDGMWIGRVLFPLALGAVALAAVRFRSLRRHPVAVSLILWAAGYTAFLAYHNNLQPRYYLVVAVPLTLLLPLVMNTLLLPIVPGGWRAAVISLSGLALLGIVIPDAFHTVEYVRNPEYTLVTAAGELRDYIAADQKEDPAHNPLVLSISGSDLSLMTGLHSICDDFGTLELPARVKKYRPGWYAAWNQIDDDKMDAMTPLFHIERVAAFPAMDDPDRNLLILYRLEDSIPTPLRLRKEPLPPKRLRTKVGQQPSTTQLEH